MNLHQHLKATWKISTKESGEDLPAGIYAVFLPSDEISPPQNSFTLTSPDVHLIIGWPNDTWKMVRSHPTTMYGFQEWAESLFPIGDFLTNMFIVKKEGQYHFGLLLGPFHPDKTIEKFPSIVTWTELHPKKWWPVLIGARTKDLKNAGLPTIAIKGKKNRSQRKKK